MNAQEALDALARIATAHAFIRETQALAPMALAELEAAAACIRQLDQWISAKAIAEAPPCH